MEKSGSKLEAADSNGSAIVGTVATPAAATAFDRATTEPAVVVPSYKPLPDEDTNWKAKANSVTIDMGKLNGSADQAEAVDDGATEKMLKDDVKLTIVPSSKDDAGVKFIPENGDAKIDIDSVKQTLSGMGKAELMKYANDPFWIRLRMFLFLAFWVLWVAMLAGAIAIIVWAPKCPAPEPRKWWEESPMIEINHKEFAKYQSEAEVFLDDLQKQNIKSLCLGSVLEESSPGLTTNFTFLSERFSTMASFGTFMSQATAKGINIVIDIDPNHSSNQHPWFKKSIEKDGNYSSYYVWADGKPNPEGGFLPPNNWVSVNGGSAWTYNEKRGQFYLHQFNASQPDLNYNNSQVIEEFSKTLKFWMNLGVTGFRLANTRYLYEDTDLKDDKPGQFYPAEKDNYDSLLHVNTRDHSQNAVLLNLWRNVVLEHTNQEGLFTLIEEVGSDTLQQNKMEKTVIDLPKSVKSLSKIASSINATQLNQTVSDMLSSSTWPAVDFSNNNHMKQRTPEDTALIYMAMLLPGTPILNINDSLPYKESFAKLTKARQNVQFQHGKTSTYVLNNGTVFSYTRNLVKVGNPGYVVIYNSDIQNKTVDISSFDQIADSIEVLALSPNHFPITEMPQKLKSDTIYMAPKSTFIGEYIVQKSAE
ncbi:neutral and basic amino acid transport protein rBAT-like isoform X1 [Trichogramma pretiosum]|uniref:neutral and basic amino acid transport protein rBAT-like isoform X1 n=1 Tax=Trichogramma pretiosum TaxID=7493 RepID=UPI000C718DD0|nr:neutral and basic amino acid transport protein rBAT-like isoform X1 [Trichogramma pretiosum]